MFEMIGDFDLGKDDFKDPQKAAVISVLVSLLRKFELPASALRFHNHMTDDKSCPGTAIDYSAFTAEVEKALAAPKPRTRSTSDRSPAVTEFFRALNHAAPAPDASAPEFDADHMLLHPETSSHRGVSGRELDFDPRAHLVNLTAGRLSATGALTTSFKDLDAIRDRHLPRELDEAREAGRPLRIMFYAHGGLGNEKDCLEAALKLIPWWRKNGIYPIYFIWETGLGETLGRLIKAEFGSIWGKITGIFGGTRGVGDFVADHTTDPAIERIARSVKGVTIWGGMKSAARLSSEENTGGAWLLAERIVAFIKDNPKEKIELHAVGHSAGSIFHAHFMDAFVSLDGRRKSIFHTLHHLAPAIRTDLFKSLVMPHLGKAITHLTCYTMRDELERADHCAHLYKKSLLYLIHYGLEAEVGCPIVGLQKSIRSDSRLKALFEPPVPGHAEVVWSSTSGGNRHSSNSRKHGDFDDDAPTMESVLRRILDNDDIVNFPAKNTRTAGPASVDFPASDTQIAIGILTEHAIRSTGMSSAPEVPVPAEKDFTAPGIIVRPGSRRRALCIGIDAYPEPRDRLGGCRNDALAWKATLESLGFSATPLLDEAATYDGIREAFARLTEGTRPGDVLAIQYSGHGTQFADQSDDRDENDGGLDEALCGHDFRTGRCIIDNEIREAVRNIAPGVAINFFMDCCHSGTNTRVVANSLDRGLPDGAVSRLVHPDRELVEAHNEFRARSRRRSSRNVTSEDDDAYSAAKESLFAAALPHQLASEIAGSGVFTSTVMKVLAGTGSGLSNEGFMAAVRNAFPAAFRSQQEPRLYSSADSRSRAFLSPLD